MEKKSTPKPRKKRFQVWVSAVTISLTKAREPRTRSVLHHLERPSVSLWCPLIPEKWSNLWWRFLRGTALTNLFQQERDCRQVYSDWLCSHPIKSMHLDSSQTAASIRDVVSEPGGRLVAADFLINLVKYRRLTFPILSQFKNLVRISSRRPKMILSA